MQILVNGELRKIEGEPLLLKVLEQLNLKMERIAVEHNLKIVPRSAWSETAVRDGDRLEIVHFVGGGSADTEPQPKCALPHGRASAFWGGDSVGTEEPGA